MLDGRCKSATAFCTSAMPLPRLMSFQARRHRDVALQVFAADFGLPGKLARSWPASRAWRSCPVLLISSVLRMASSDAAILLGKRTRMV